VLGAAGLAIGLALQGTLANIAAGVMLIYLRPFKVGDYIEVEDIAGTVKEIGLFVTHLETWDGLFLFAPNSKIWDRPLKNHTRNAVRLINIVIEISYGSDPAVARRVLLDLADDDPRVLKDPPPYVYVEDYGDNGVKLTFRAWAPNAIYWDVHRALIEEAKRRLESAGIEIAFPHRIVHFVPGQDSTPTPPGSAATAPKESEARK
jgi:small conductance mechanosensitive channel